MNYNQFCLKVIACSLRKIQNVYEIKTAPFFIYYLRFLFYPLYLLLRYFKICFVVNIANGTGHVIAELDHFLRLKLRKNIDLTKRYVWICKSSELFKVTVKYYKNDFFYAKSSTLLYDLFLPYIIGFHDITLDVGVSRLKWQLSKKMPHYLQPLGQDFYHQLSKEEIMKVWVNYYQLRVETLDDFPLKKTYPISKPLYDFFHGNFKKLALIHIKNSVMNATALATNPATYLTALEWLHLQGYQLVFVGREKMPEIFKQYPIKNYAQSSIASFENDMQLFIKAEISIISGSGISFLADCFDKPYLYINSWQMPMAMFARKCFTVPALVTKPCGTLLKFKEQIDLYLNLEDKGAEIFPHNEYKVRNATNDEIVEGIKELIKFQVNDEPESTLQLKFRSLAPTSCLFYAKSRYSDYFLQKHVDLF